jgi:hypothetical protein
MKILIALIITIVITGCKPEPESRINAAALRIAESFITEHIRSSLNFRVKGVSTVRTTGDSTFYVTGSVEGFSSYNVPLV